MLNALTRRVGWAPSARIAAATATARIRRALPSAWPEPARDILVGESNGKLVNPGNAGVFGNDPADGVPITKAPAPNHQDQIAPGDRAPHPSACFQTQY